MKNKLTIIFCLLFTVIVANAQTENSRALYLTFGNAYGTYWGMSVGLNYIHQGTYSVQLNYFEANRPAKSTPDDCKKADWYIPFLGSLDDAYDEFGEFELLVGKIYPLNTKRTIRANLMGGVGFYSYREPTNWTKNENDHYVWENNIHHGVSLVLNSRLEFPFSKIVGVYLSPKVVLNKDFTYAGVGVGFMLGRVK